MAILRGTSKDGIVKFYTGKAGDGWLSADQSEAFFYSVSGAMCDYPQDHPAKDCDEHSHCVYCGASDLHRGYEDDGREYCDQCCTRGCEGFVFE